MDFIKRQAFYIVCGVVAAAGIGLLVTGVQAVGRVPQEMDKAKGLYSSLGQLAGAALNDRVLQAEQERIAASKADHEAVLNKAKQLYGWEPLVEGVFPDGNEELRRQFRRRFGQAMRDLLDPEVVRWGLPADESAIGIMKDRIAEEQFRAKERNLDQGAPSASPGPSGPPRTRAGVLTVDGAREDAAARAHMAAAQRIYLYATPIDAVVTRDRKPVPSLDFYGSMTETGTIEAPFAEDCWHAQVAYWIQKDVIEAIVATNNDVAEELRSRDEPRWVGTMAIKDIIGIRVYTGYVQPEDASSIIGATAGGYDAALPPATPANVFTHNAQNELFDVKQFTVKLIMDQREINRFVQKLTANRFHTLLRASYAAEPLNRNMTGKIYGSGPVVNVVLDFETVMLGDVFRPLMPAEVCERYEIPCPERAGE